MKESYFFDSIYAFWQALNRHGDHWEGKPMRPNPKGYDKHWVRVQ